MCDRHGVTRERVTGVVMASVVPPLTGTTVAMVRDYFGRAALNVEPAVNGGMPILYESPGEVGADRFVDARVLNLDRHRDADPGARVERDLGSERGILPAVHEHGRRATARRTRQSSER